MINDKDLTPDPDPDDELVTIGTPAPAEVGYRIPPPEDPAERAQFEAAVGLRAALGLSPFVGEDHMAGTLPVAAPAPVRSGVPVATAVDTAIGEVIAIHDRLVERGVLMPTALSAAVDQLRQAVRLEAPLPPSVPLMNVRVLDRGTSVTSVAAVRNVTVPAVCPRCGGPRSQELVELHSWVHGIEMIYDGWHNPCGHVDAYEALLAEARRFDELVRGGA